MKKILFTMMILAGFVISAQAQSVQGRRVRHERRMERRMELRKLHRIERRRHHRRRRMMSFENHMINSQSLVVYKSQTPQTTLI